jgi:hypothetical protein
MKLEQKLMGRVMTLWTLFTATGVLLGAMFHLAWDHPWHGMPGLEYVLVGDRNPSVITNEPRNAHTVIFTASTNLMISGPLSTGTWYYVCYAVLSNVWSEPSNVLEVRIPGPPTNMVRVAVDVSPDMRLWTNAGFIRLRIGQP